MSDPIQVVLEFEKLIKTNRNIGTAKKFSGPFASFATFAMSSSNYFLC
jgi:hypothetical protein